MLKNSIVITNNIVEYFSSYIMQDKPIFFSRFGGSDTSIIRQYYKNKNLINNNEWYQKHSNIVKMYNGYFDFNNDISNFQKFLEDMIVYYKNTDDSSYCGSYIIDGDDAFFDYVLDGKTIVNYGFIESVRPFLKSFTDWGLNKKILIISPFSKSIEYQFKNKGNLYLDYRFPEFVLKTYNTKITYNAVGDTKKSLGLITNNWHEECQRMAEDISKIDFDVALLSCASYGMFLGNYIKYNMGKKSIYLGGILNVFFNIYGGRYKDELLYYKPCGLNPDTRIDPFENSDVEKICGGKDKSTEALNAYFGKRKGNVESNVGKWNNWFSYIKLDSEPFFYGKTITYELGNEFLRDCQIVEDWGTGGGGFKSYRKDAIGIDGSNTPFAEKKFVDLVYYVSNCDGIFMRHVLEHNYEWNKILHNAIKSANKKICIVMFIPFNDGETKQLAFNSIGVPDLAIGKNEFHLILQQYPNIKYSCVDYKTETQYGYEQIIYIEKME